MLQAYPIIITPDDSMFIVTIPDFNLNTQGRDVPEAIFMARDAIGLMAIDNEDDGIANPAPSPISSMKKIKADEILTLVDVDFAEYRRQNDLRTVRRNCSLPAWLDAEANKAKINVSAVLQNALKQELHLA
ncbi:MAG: type II toxin-antitoxin system HicB family antitoxin [Oscillospiraceae bacterium]|nr:type II toxin-antitoxin system HicB family antitoxin [Oscillospiraceae bacterium]